jgi:ABC-type Fe3+-hydroxamate transport system substrate-binding protein
MTTTLLSHSRTLKARELGILSPNLEELAPLQPNLVISRDSNALDVADQLTRIAPVVTVGPDGSWRPDLVAAGEALERSADVGACLDEYDRLLATTRAAARDALGATVASECVRLFARVDDLL